MTDSAPRCPGCGAPAAPDAASCAYCGSALATVNCASCFAPMFRGSRFCARCGAEAKREVVEESKALQCPRCSESMQALRLGPTDVHECGACGGLWLEPETLQRLSEARESHADVVSVLVARAPVGTVAPDVVRYVPCPSCAKLMNRTNFAKSSGIVLDVCKNHGVWLDRGELQRVLQFIDSGGLAHAREREAQQLVEERRRLESLRNLPTQSSGSPAVFYDEQPPAQDAATATLAHVLFDAARLFIGTGR